MCVLSATACRGTEPSRVASSAPVVSSAVGASDAAISTTRENRERAPVAALIGTTPPEWNVERWLNGKARTLMSLRGSVVMVRWWTADCPFCSASAPALRAFHSEYGPRGLAVLGMYHHKEDTPFDPNVYEETARNYGFEFPLAFDPDWRTFHTWMRDCDGRRVDTGYTSVTFVLDKRGVVRHVHPGGQYVAGDPAHAELRAVVESLLAER